jgi:hypothetical protein
MPHSPLKKLHNPVFSLEKDDLMLFTLGHKRSRGRISVSLFSKRIVVSPCLPSQLMPSPASLGKSSSSGVEYKNPNAKGISR